MSEEVELCSVDSHAVKEIFRRAAQLRRGDLGRWAREHGRALLPAPAPGTVWTGFALNPRPALRIEDVDLHELARRGIAEAIEAIAPAPLLIGPWVPRSPRRLSARERDLDRVRSSVHNLPGHWELREIGAGKALILRPYYAVGDSVLATGDALDIRVDILREVGSEHVGQGDGALARAPSVRWKEHPTTPAEAANAPLAVPQPTMPVDVVFTWVNGDDPDWRARRDRALRSMPASALHPTSTDETRFVEAEELRYSLRSVHRYAGWIRRIHIVTDSQAPAWLDIDHPKINLVDHSEILEGSRFNSHAIEAALHRIPGLADHYLYFNDDVFLGRIAYPGDFFAAEGISLFYPSELAIPPGPASPEDMPIDAAAKNGRDLIAERFGIEVPTKIRHTVHPQQREVVGQIEEENPQLLARVRDAAFRSPTDLSVASSLHHWYAYALSRAVPAQPNYLYLDIMRSEAPQMLDALVSLRRYDTFCLNQEATRRGTDRARAEMRRFLERYFPGAAPWERDRATVR